MTAAFQLNAFQPNAFQTLVVTGVIYAPDQDDIANINGTVTGGESNVDMHDGFTYKEIKQIEKIRKKLEKLRLEEEKAFAETNKRRKQTIIDIVEPPVVSVKQNEVELTQAIEVPTVDIVKLSAEIARLELQRQLLERQVAQKQALQAYQQYIAHIEALAKAELDDEEALLMLL